jgi:hypothetical protein
MREAAMWKRAVTAVILALAISPALASESAGSRLAAAVRASDVSSASQALTDARRPSTRPDSSERKIDEPSQSTLTGDEPSRAALAETQGEFLKAVWTN